MTDPTPGALGSDPPAGAVEPAPGRPDAATEAEAEEPDGPESAPEAPEAAEPGSPGAEPEPARGRAAGTYRQALGDAWRVVRYDIPASQRRRLGWAVLGSSLLAVLDIVGVVLLALAMAALVSGAAAGTSSVPLVGPLLAGLPVGVVVGVATALLIVKSVLSLAVLYRIQLFLGRLRVELASSFLLRVLSAPLSVVQRVHGQDVVTAVLAGSARSMALVQHSVSLVTDSALVVCFAALLILVDPLLAVMSLVVFLVTGVVVARVSGRMLHRTAGKLWRGFSVASRAVSEAVSLPREMRLYHLQGWAVHRFYDGAWANSRGLAMEGLLQQVPKVVLEAALVVALAGAGLAAYAKDSPEAAAASLSVFALAAVRLTPALLRVQTALGGLRFNAGARVVFDQIGPLPPLPAGAAKDGVLTAVTATQAAAGAGPASPGAGEETTDRTAQPPTVEVEHVTFTYPGAPRPALRDVTAVFPAGRVTALVGPTGSGKSTLADLVLGLLTPDSGLVRSGPGEGGVGYVPQEVVLIADTVRRNVALGVHDPAAPAVAEALDGAGVLGVVESLPDGLDTTVGERGAGLSGGQRQRVGVARALYRQPTLLILDEATSALDVETEQVVIDTIQRLRGTTTVILIAHRLSTIRLADRVVLLEDGQVTGSGGFDELMAASETFARHVRLQRS